MALLLDCLLGIRGLLHGHCMLAVAEPKPHVLSTKPLLHPLACRATARHGRPKSREERYTEVLAVSWL